MLYKHFSPHKNGYSKSSTFQYYCLCVLLCLVTKSCLTLCNPMDCSLPGSSVHGYSPGMNNGVGCHAFLQGIFPTQGLNPGLLHCRQILYHLSQKNCLLLRDKTVVTFRTTHQLLHKNDILMFYEGNSPITEELPPGWALKFMLRSLHYIL